MAERLFVISLLSQTSFREGTMEAAFTSAFAAVDDAILALNDPISRHSGATALCAVILDNVLRTDEKVFLD
jgi:hypothetical protein